MAELKKFYKEVEKYKLDDIISIDETSISTSLSVNYCRNDLGKRCIIKTDDNAVFKKYSLVVAISNKKCLGYKLYENGAVNADRFNNFLIEILKNVKNKLIILDNGQIHKKENVKNTIINSGNKLLYTCPYHPRLNTIENWFNQLKHYIKQDKPKNFNELKESLKNSINKIKKEHYENYFIYAYDKKSYKNNKKNSKKSSKYRKPKIYKVGI
jgi:transposase